MNLARWAILAVSVVIIAAACIASEKTAPDSASPDQLIDAYIKLPSQAERSQEQGGEARAIAAKLALLDHSKLGKVLLDRIAEATGHELAKCRDLLRQLGPALKSDFFARAAAEGNAARKRRFIRIADAFWGPEAARFLVSQLDDKRSAEPDWGPTALRICDVALNVLNKNAGKDLDVHIGVGTGYGGDTIVRDVPIQSRDQWIDALKQAVIAKYGANLDLPSQL
jgi:hypothetical protein